MVAGEGGDPNQDTNKRGSPEAQEEAKTTERIRRLKNIFEKEEVQEKPDGRKKNLAREDTRLPFPLKELVVTK